jgi:hypothetical protein
VLPAPAKRCTYKVRNNRTISRLLLLLMLLAGTSINYAASFGPSALTTLSL